MGQFRPIIFAIGTQYAMQTVKIPHSNSEIVYTILMNK